MKLALNQTIHNLDNQPIKDGPSNEELTVKAVCIFALSAVIQGENPSGQEKFDRHILAMKIKDADDPVDLTVEEIAKLKELVGRVPTFGPTIVGPVYLALEQNIQEDAQTE